MGDRATRGKGVLEGALARRRARMANRLIPRDARAGSLLDLGCGSHPLFLLQAPVARRFGVDRLAAAPRVDLDGVVVLRHDLATGGALPFDDRSFDVVSMLAVLEHIPVEAVGLLLGDVWRVLRPGGRLIITTPAGWTDPILRGMARLGLVSHEEIDEHEAGYDQASIAQHLVRAGFPPDRVRTGTFELFMNLWATADR